MHLFFSFLYSQLSLLLALHSGASWYMGSEPCTASPGLDAGGEIACTVRGVISRDVALGIQTGVGIAYAGTGYTYPDYREQYTNIDYYPERMDYTITTESYRERHHRCYLEVPLMASLRLHAFTANVGAAAMFTVAQRRRLDVTGSQIEAYYPDFMVPVVNYLATGRLEDNAYHSSGAGHMPTVDVLLAAELGYEWERPNGQALGVRLYVRYGVWDNYVNKPAGSRLIDVAPILNTEYPVPDIAVHYLSDTYVSDVHYLSVGIKGYYAFPLRSPRRIYPCRCLF